MLSLDKPPPTHSKRLTFQLQRCILCFAILVNLVYLTLFQLYADRLVSRVLHHFDRHFGTTPELPHRRVYYQNLAQTTLYLTGVNLVLLELTLLVGIVRGVLCLARLYTVTAFVTTLGTLLLSTVVHPVLVVHSLWAAFITMIATLYTKQLANIIREETEFALHDSTTINGNHYEHFRPKLSIVSIDSSTRMVV